MKILIVASYSRSLINFRLQLIEALLASGYKVHVAVPGMHTDKPTVEMLHSKGVVTHNISLFRNGINPFKDTFTLISIFVLALRIRPTHFLGYTIKPVIYGNIAAYLARVPHRFALITGLGYAFQDSVKPNFVKRVVSYISKKLYVVALGNSEKVIFQNPDDRDLFLELGIVKDPIQTAVVNGSGVDCQAFSVSAQPEMISFLLIARLLGDKGVREYAQAAKIVKGKHPEATFQLVGWLDPGPDCIGQEELDGWVNDSTIEFFGKLDDVRPAIAACSVYVLPSYREGTPRTVLEAMAMGRAIITTDAPGCRETVVDGYNGYLVAPKSVESLVVAILRFIEDSTIVGEMGENSRILAVEKYDVHNVNDAMLAVMGIQSL